MVSACSLILKNNQKIQSFFTMWLSDYRHSSSIKVKTLLHLSFTTKRTMWNLCILFKKVLWVSDTMYILKDFQKLKMELRWQCMLTRVLSYAITMCAVTRGVNLSIQLPVHSLWKVSLSQKNSSNNKYSPSIKNKQLKLKLNQSWDTKQMSEKEF